MTPARWVYAVFDEFSQHTARNYKGQSIPHYDYETLKGLVQKAAQSQPADPAIRRLISEERGTDIHTDGHDIQGAWTSPGKNKTLPS